jgi:hypothetical protein
MLTPQHLAILCYVRRVSAIIRAPSAVEFSALVQQLLLDLDASTEETCGVGWAGLCAMALLAVNEETEPSSEGATYSAPFPSATGIAWNAAELSEVLLHLLLDADQQQQQQQRRHLLEPRVDTSGNVGMRLAAILIPRLLSNAAASRTTSSSISSSFNGSGGYRHTNAAPWNPTEHLALCAIKRFIQEAFNGSPLRQTGLKGPVVNSRHPTPAPPQSTAHHPPTR